MWQTWFFSRFEHNHTWMSIYEHVHLIACILQHVYILWHNYVEVKAVYSIEAAVVFIPQISCCITVVNISNNKEIPVQCTSKTYLLPCFDTVFHTIMQSPTCEELVQRNESHAFSLWLTYQVCHSILLLACKSGVLVQFACFSVLQWRMDSVPCTHQPQENTSFFANKMVQWCRTRYE